MVKDTNTEPLGHWIDYVQTFASICSVNIKTNQPLIFWWWHLQYKALHYITFESVTDMYLPYTCVIYSLHTYDLKFSWKLCALMSSLVSQCFKDYLFFHIQGLMWWATWPHTVFIPQSMLMAAPTQTTEMEATRNRHDLRPHMANHPRRLRAFNIQFLPHIFKMYITDIFSIFINWVLCIQKYSLGL